MGATMSDQVGFHEARCGLIPIVTGANRELFLEQCCGSGRRESRSLLLPLRLQDPISCGWTHRKQISTTLFAPGQMSRPF